MKTKLCLAAMVAALMIVIGPLAPAGATCPAGTTDVSYCSTGAPIVTTTAATNVTSTSATLNGTVNPNGLNTSYKFEYGLAANALTSSTTVTNITVTGVLADYQPKNVSFNLTGLTPSTTYFFRITATNSAAPGGVNGDTLQFTTAAASGTATEPTVVTGAASNVTQTSAVVAGTINPNGSSAFAAFEYGTTTAYGTRTPATAAGAGTTAVPAGASLAGLTPGTLYHYRIVGANAAGVAFGQDRTFTTLVYQVPPEGTGKLRPGLTLRVKPRRDRKKPFRYRARGRLKLPRGITKAQGCKGRVVVRITRGNHLITKKKTRIKGNCRYTKRLLAKKRLSRSGSGKMRVRARFLGNAVLTQRKSRVVRIKYGPILRK